MVTKTYEDLSQLLTRSWVAGYILAMEDVQRDLENVQKNLSGNALAKYLEQKLKQSLKDAQDTLKHMEKE